MRVGGYLVVSDVSGYTEFLAETERDHGSEVIAALLEALVDAHHPPLEVSKLEGDAVLAWMRCSHEWKTQTLLELVEGLYAAFRLARGKMELGTKCGCSACSGIGDLDLKVFVHRGEFDVQRIREHEELSGLDVVLIHRLMKNSVREQTGISAYALLTDAVCTSLEGGRAHQEEYEHIGQVPVRVWDLHAAWDEHQQHRGVCLSPEDADMVVTVNVNAPLAQTWDVVTTPEGLATLIGSQGSRLDKNGDRTGIDSRFHCAHGPTDTTRSVVDWRPFEYLTFEDEVRLPFGVGVQQVVTHWFEPAGPHTRVVVCFSLPKTWLPQRIWSLAKKILRRDLEKGAVKLNELIAQQSIDGAPSPSATK